jgi:hypothetical protein
MATVSLEPPLSWRRLSQFSNAPSPPALFPTNTLQPITVPLTVFSTVVLRLCVHSGERQHGHLSSHRSIMACRRFWPAAGCSTIFDAFKSQATDLERPLRALLSTPPFFYRIYKLPCVVPVMLLLQPQACSIESDRCACLPAACLLLKYFLNNHLFRLYH